jgi:mannose-6-phosphate isomerase-like protein (cupin superfamily)
VPVIKREDFGTERVPDWCKVAGGIVAMGASSRGPEGTVELHFHDCEEFWFVLKGKARIVTEGQEHVVERGDVVCTHMGDEHAILEVLDAPYEQVWIECDLRGRMRRGHLHRSAEGPPRGAERLSGRKGARPSPASPPRRRS